MKKSIEFLNKNKVAVFVVAYNAEKHIQSVLERMPADLRSLFAEIYVIEDSSKDSTKLVAERTGDQLGLTNLNVLRTPYNRGYGGNQKLGYLYAVKKNYDYVILLHGDGQYPPEALEDIVEKLADQQPDAVFASRMVNKFDALRGKMPLYKWVGNQVLTLFENLSLGSNLSEFHTGYRCYKVATLAKLPYLFNSDDFHFDTEIIIQLLATKHKIAEIAIPTHYGDEVCHVNGMAYAWNCFKSVVKFKLVQMGLFYEPSFDFNAFENSNYFLRKSESPLAQHLSTFDWQSDWSVLELGAGEGELSARLAQKCSRVVSVDRQTPTKAGRAEAVALNLDETFSSALGTKVYDRVIALDVIEHLNRPDISLQNIFNTMKAGGLLYSSTGNISHWLMRASLLLGQFNYGKRRVLNLTHKRLFTIYSFKKLLKQNGFQIREVKAFGPPIKDFLGDTSLLRFLDSSSRWLARVWPSLFAYNYLVTAERMDSVDDLLMKTMASKRTQDEVVPQIKYFAEASRVEEPSIA